jgi:hypothetical protein
MQRHCSSYVFKNQAWEKYVGELIGIHARLSFIWTAKLKKNLDISKYFDKNFSKKIIIDFWPLEGVLKLFSSMHNVCKSHNLWYN